MILIESHYLPCTAYFSLIAISGQVKIERYEHYVKQTFRNRCYINTEHGRDVMIIPLTSKHSNTLITDVRIDYSQKWLKNHWRTIGSAYGNAPFFEYYRDDLEKVLFTRHVFLYDLNLDLLTMCLRWLRLDVVVEETLSYEKNSSDGILDFRSFITPKKPDNVVQVYRPVPYHQVFGSAFADNLSLIDLIFCVGPEAGRIVRESAVAG